MSDGSGVGRAASRELRELSGQRWLSRQLGRTAVSELTAEQDRAGQRTAEQDGEDGGHDGEGGRRTVEGVTTGICWLATSR